MLALTRAVSSQMHRTHIEQVGTAHSHRPGGPVARMPEGLVLPVARFPEIPAGRRLGGPAARGAGFQNHPKGPEGPLCKQWQAGLDRELRCAGCVDSPLSCLFALRPVR